MMVSWHAVARPVSLTLTSPSGKVIAPGSTAFFNSKGSSYQFFRIQSPEVGEWQLRVVVAKNLDSGVAAYTWGVYGTTPVRARVVLPRRILGAKSIQAMLTLQAPARVVVSSKFSGAGVSPKASLKALLEQHASELKEIKLPFDPDKPTDPDLYRLAALDHQLVAQGKPSLFATTVLALRMNAAARPAANLNTSVPGTYHLHIQAEGKTQGGNLFQRQTLNSLTV
jgi:hypothetical protein